MLTLYNQKETKRAIFFKTALQNIFIFRYFVLRV